VYDGDRADYPVTPQPGSPTHAATSGKAADSAVPDGCRGGAQMLSTFDLQTGIGAG